MTKPRRMLALSVPALTAATLLLAGCVMPGMPGGGGGGGTGDPKAAVENYFAALAAVDAKAAKDALGEVRAADAKYLTQEMLEASQELAPIDDIEVGEPDSESQYSAEVPVSFTLGGEPYDMDVRVSNYGDEWTIDGALGSVALHKYGPLGLTLNGIPVEGSDMVTVFPGAYELAVQTPNFELKGDTIVFALDPYLTADDSAIEAGLTDEALATFRDLVRTAVAECVASTTLAAGCGLDLPDTLSDGTVLSEGSIVRTLSADASATIDSMVPTLSYKNPTLAEGEFIGGVTTTATCTQGGSSGTCSIIFGPSLGLPTIDMAATSPIVIWE